MTIIHHFGKLGHFESVKFPVNDLAAREKRFMQSNLRPLSSYMTFAARSWDVLAYIVTVQYGYGAPRNRRSFQKSEEAILVATSRHLHRSISTSLIPLPTVYRFLPPLVAWS